MALLSSSVPCIKGLRLSSPLCLSISYQSATICPLSEPIYFVFVAISLLLDGQAGLLLFSAGGAVLVAIVLLLLLAVDTVGGYCLAYLIAMLQLQTGNVADFLWRVHFKEGGAVGLGCRFGLVLERNEQESEKRAVLSDANHTHMSFVPNSSLSFVNKQTHML